MYPTTSGVIVMDAAAELFPSNSQQSPLRERRPEKGRTAGGIFAALLARAAVNAAHCRSTQLPSDRPERLFTLLQDQKLLQNQG